MDSKNMKLVKFNLFCKELRNYFRPDEQLTLPIYLIPREFQEKNEYIRCVADVCFWDPAVCNTDIGIWPLGRYNSDVSYDLEELVKVIEHVKQNRDKCAVSVGVVGGGIAQKTNPTTDYFTAEIVFWNLLSIALDDECYNSELSRVIDLAYCLGFTPEMIGDWCRAVEYVLAGNQLSKNCDLHCDTAEGAIFFLHKEDSDGKVSGNPIVDIPSWMRRR